MRIKNTQPSWLPNGDISRDTAGESRHALSNHHILSIGKTPKWNGQRKNEERRYRRRGFRHEIKMHLPGA